MSVPPAAQATAPLPPLPHWESVPADLPGAIRQVKAALRSRIAASGRTVDDVFSVAEQRVRAEVDEILAARHHGEAIWPVIDYADIEAGTVPADARARLRRRGCLVVRGHFDRGQARGWDSDILDYVESNAFFENYRGPGDDFFAAVGSRPEIYPIYWSAPQMQARQSRPDRPGCTPTLVDRQCAARLRGADARVRRSALATRCTRDRSPAPARLDPAPPCRVASGRTPSRPSALPHTAAALADVRGRCGVTVNQVLPAHRTVPLHPGCSLLDGALAEPVALCHRRPGNALIPRTCAGHPGGRGVHGVARAALPGRHRPSRVRH